MLINILIENRQPEKTVLHNIDTLKQNNVYRYQNNKGHSQNNEKNKIFR